MKTTDLPEHEVYVSQEPNNVPNSSTKSIAEIMNNMNYLHILKSRVRDLLSQELYTQP